MKIIKAEWEMRNLGVKTYEISLENEKDFKKLLIFENNNDYEYLVVKIPAHLMSYFLNIQDLGYKFIEMNTVCHYICSTPYTLTSIQKRLYRNISYKLMDRKDIDYLFDRISEGMFSTDRISLDPFFSKEQSSNRYIGWINDELDCGSNIYNIYYKENKVGFFGLSKIYKNECFAFLGGIYPEYQLLGIGTIMNYLEIDEAKAQGATRLKTSFSSNNRGAYAVHLSMNYVLEDNCYIFIKHK